MQPTQGLRPMLARLARTPLAACAAVALPLTLAAVTTSFNGSRPAGAGPLGPAVAAHPHLTANTNAGCNKPMPKGYMRCFAIIRTPADHRVTADSSGPPSGALGPADIQSAYKLPSATAGGGQTVFIVDAGGDPTADSDLATFRSYYGLPACTTANGCFKQVNQNGQASPLPPVDSDWPVEESLDLDAVSSACPNCNLVLVEADSNSDTDLLLAEDQALSMGAKFISNSYGGPEMAGEDWPHEAGVAITFSAGDSGYGVNFPSAYPLVTAVGGTTLTRDASVPRGWTETVWGSASGGEGTGSGCSAYEPQPAFQQGIPQLDAVCSHRATVDVSADANPASGLAIYDTTGEGGWLQVGGTSLASPLIAATYALAGRPVAGSYPNSYPYHDPSQSSDLFDITTGANGNCGNVLCQAGPGWDGPTGLGTPDGVKAFQSGPQGKISGQVTNAATGKPVAGVTVTAQAGDYVTRTGASGDYEMSVQAGTYASLTASEFEYKTVTDTGVTVTANQTTTENFTLTPAPSGSLSGTVTGSGHGWPLHAQISISGDPNGPVWASPYTGAYRVSLPQGSYTLDVSTDYPGYQAKQVQVTVGATTTQNFALDADLTACTAPGYGLEGLTQDFDGWTGSAARDGWAVSGTGPPGRARAGWRFDNPGNRTPPPSGSIPSYFDPHYNTFVYFDGDSFATADAGYYNPRPLHTALTSPQVDLSGQRAPQISFDSAYYPDVPPGTGRAPAASVQLSTDGGHRWATVWQRGSSNAIGPVTIAVPQAAGRSGVRARWVFTGGGLGYWAVGDVVIGTKTCALQPGGLIVGVVTSHATGKPVYGAQTADTVAPPPYPWPEGISLASADPALAGAFYWLFTPAGSVPLSATAAGYARARATVNVAPDKETRHDWALIPAAGSRS